MLVTMGERWFHGFISFEEAEECLRGCAPGTFLVRFSQSQLCSYAAAYVDKKHRVQQLIIASTKKDGFQMGGKLYTSVSDTIDNNKHVFKFAAPNTLSKLDYFHGFLTYGESVELLADQPIGTYVSQCLFQCLFQSLI